MQAGLPGLGRNPEFAWIYHGESTAITMNQQISLWGLQSSGAVFPQSSIGEAFPLMTVRKKRGEKELGVENPVWLPG